MPIEKDIDLQPRIAGGRTDIGADELNILSPTLGITPLVSGTAGVSVTAEPGHPFILEESDTLTNWQTFLTNNPANTYLVGADIQNFTNSTTGSAGFFQVQMLQ